MIAAILLAGGGSRRFGRRNKLLAPIRRGDTLLRRALVGLDRMPAQRRIVVTGADRARIARAVGPARRRVVVHNPDWKAGLAASLKRGLRALRPVDRIVIILLADVPGQAAAPLRALLREIARGADAARPASRGLPGHPVVVHRSALARVAPAGDEGLWRALKDQGGGRAMSIRGAQGTARDIDTIAALRRLRVRLREPERDRRV